MVKKTIVYNCPFVPGEWISAHNMQPLRILSRTVRRNSSFGTAAGLCPYGRAFVEEVLSKKGVSAVIFTTRCDQMRRLSELVKQGRTSLPVFLMNIPSTWQTPVAHKIYLSELERLGKFMINLGGNFPSDKHLTKIMCKYNALRSILRSAKPNLSAKNFSEAIADFYRTRKLDLDKFRSAVRKTGIPIAIIGGPLTPEYFWVFDIIEESGGRVVLDGSENGERTLPGQFELGQVQNNPVMELTNVYFGRIPDPFRRPNDEFYEWLKGEIGQREIKGIILWRYIWCDIWHGEVQRLKEWLNIPVIDIAVEGDGEANFHIVQRIQSLLEALK